MAYYIGRAIQVIGMIGLGVAFYRGYAQDDMTGELTGLAIGAALFLVGRAIERRFARS